MPCVYSKNYNYIICYSAKSGCTLFRRLFLHLHKNELNREPTHCWHQLEKDFPLPENIENIPIIFLGRNPYKRIVSMFTNKYCGGKGISILPRFFKLDKITFRNFVYKLKELKANKRLNYTNIHISEQSDCIKKLNKNNINFVKLENFYYEIVEIYKKLKLDELIPEINKFLATNTVSNISPKNNETDYIYDKEYSIEDIIFPDYKYFYNNELFEEVYKLYEIDFLTFNYNKNNLN